jgi:arylsulfatase A-like enzyme
MIRAAYDGRLGPFNALLLGRDWRDLDSYLAIWRLVALTGTVLVGGALLLVLFMRRHPWRVEAALVRAVDRVPALRDADVLLLAAALALAAGLIESLWWIVQYSVFHRPIPRTASPDLIWTTPASALATLLILAVLLNAVSRATRVRAPRARGLAATVLCFAAVYSVALVLPLAIHAAARAILSLGIATLFMRALRARPVAVLTLARRTVVAGAVVVLLCIALLPILRSVRYRNSLSVAAAARGGAPNVILIVWDTVRAASLSLYGYDRLTTPNLDRLAQRGVVFDNAIAAAPWTLPSHASMFTGLYHHEHSADRRSPLADSTLTLAEHLRSRGYQTAGFIGNTHWVGSVFGLGQGFGWYEDRPLMTVRSVLLTWRGARLIFGSIVKAENSAQLERVPAERLQAAFLRWLDDRDQSRPFFAFLNEFDAHEPYLPPSHEFRFSSRTPLYRWDYLTGKRRWSRDELRDLNDAYDACIHYLDQQLGRLHAELERRGLLENTLLVLTSDHGETLGEQDPRLLGHAHNAYYDVLKVPLAMFWPSGIDGGRRVDELVSLVDLPATLTDAVDDLREQEKPFPGTSLWPLVLGGGRVTPRPALSQVNPAGYHGTWNGWPTFNGSLYSLVGVDGYHYIASARGTEQLFDVKTDPWERKDLAATPAGRTVAARYRNEITKLIPGYPGTASALVTASPD